MENKSNLIYKIKTASGSGTGFYVSGANVFVTNYHVVKGTHHVAIEDNSKHSFVGEVVLVNPEEDLAIITSSEALTIGEPLAIGDSSLLSSRDEVFVLGYPYGMPYTETKGIVSSPKQLMDGKHYIQTDAPINPGNSGGALVNGKGELIGIVTAKFSDADNMGFAIPSSVLNKLLAVYEKNKPTTFSVQCSSCDYLETQATDNCDNCGGDFDATIFEPSEMTKLALRVEEGLARNGINPIIARNGYEYWSFYQGSTFIRIYIYNYDFVCSAAPLNDIATENIEEIMRYLLSDPIPPYQLGTYEKTIQLGCRVHVSDLFNEKYGDQYLDRLINLSKKADEMDDYLLDTYNCPRAVEARV